MTEQYWKDYKRQISLDPMHSDDQFWKRVQQDIKAKQSPKHHLELYSYCRSENPFIRQIKNSPNITTDTVAEIICREKSCELMYCMLLQQKQSENRRSKINIQGCNQQYNTMNSCLNEEKMRIATKEHELRQKISQLQEEKEFPLIQTEDLTNIYTQVYPEVTIQQTKMEMDI